MAPVVLALVSRQRRRMHSVADALQNRARISDIQGALGPAATVQYGALWRMLRPIVLSPTPDSLHWRWTANGVYSARSCYQALFAGSTTSPHWELTWRTWAPLRIRFFIWLANLDRCWTAARLGRHVFPIMTRAFFATKPMKLCSTS